MYPRTPSRLSNIRQNTNGARWEQNGLQQRERYGRRLVARAKYASETVSSPYMIDGAIPHNTSLPYTKSIQHNSTLPLPSPSFPPLPRLAYSVSLTSNDSSLASEEFSLGYGSPEMLSTECVCDEPYHDTERQAPGGGSIEQKEQEGGDKWRESGLSLSPAPSHPTS